MTGAKETRIVSRQTLSVPARTLYIAQCAGATVNEGLKNLAVLKNVFSHNKGLHVCVNRAVAHLVELTFTMGDNNL